MRSHELDTSIPIESLLVTQSSLRVFDRVTRMVDFVRRGGHFTPDQVASFHEGEANRFGLIILSRFQNGQIYVHDGHHRSVSAYLGGRKYFAFEEREIVDWDSIERYNEINVEKGWVTPLDLLNEVRLPDILKYKEEALSLTGELQIAFIKSKRHRYAVRRQIHTVADMGRSIQDWEGLFLAA